MSNQSVSSCTDTRGASGATGDASDHDGVHGALEAKQDGGGDLEGGGVAAKDNTCNELSTPASFVAAAANDWSRVRLMLLTGYDVNARCPTDPLKPSRRTTRPRPRVMCDTNRTLLHLAVVRSQLETARMLIDLGADVNAQDDRGATPLMLAARTERTSEMVEFLLLNGADVGVVTHDGPIVTDFPYSDDDDDELSESPHDASPSTTDPHPPPRYDDAVYENIAFHGRRTCLHYALMSNNLVETIVRLLLGFGADVNAQDGMGRTALHRALEGLRRRHVFPLLLSTPGINIEPVSKDVNFGYDTVLGGTPLYRASEYYAEEAQLLIEAGANPNVTDRRKTSTPLMMAASKDNVDLMRALIEAGADARWRSCYGANVLRIVVYEGNLEAVELILSVIPPVDVNEVDQYGWTPLMTAAQAQPIGHHLRILHRLMRAGADVHHVGLVEPDETGDEFIPDEGWTYGYNAVSAAVTSGRLGNLKVILEAKPRVDLRFPDDHQTPFIFCAAQNHNNMLEPLAEAGSDINAVDHEGNTALHWAARNDHKHCVEVLLKLGVDASIKNKENQTARDVNSKIFDEV